jgi:hypothetical protein
LICEKRLVVGTEGFSFSISLLGLLKDVWDGSLRSMRKNVTPRLSRDKITMVCLHLYIKYVKYYPTSKKRGRIKALRLAPIDVATVKMLLA